ncbi:DUF2846 domain-containing protein [Neptunomonas antarctica]|uniref:DUF2846 domain-containing protein n=1 Tax=Neptunomonas antarctica TaxID=619304 RepID=A0A1N7L2L1_9GAMM|nr:DUF2846 domain-containing protein [Neptunomonas antarctica]SIS68054.1 Protein of unknown function [Neptunomonas antarctica]
MKAWYLATLIGFFGLLSGCASAPGAQYNKELHVKQNNKSASQVVVYRYKQFAGSADITEIIDNGEAKGSIANGGFIVYETEPGIHKMHTNTLGIDQPVTIDMSANQTYYFRADFRPSWIGFWRLSAIHSQQAASELPQTRAMSNPE